MTTGLVSGESSVLHAPMELFVCLPRTGEKRRKGEHDV